MKKYLLVVLLLAWSNLVLSDDIDLYIDNTDASVERPNVLIILDNSGSMGSVNTNGSKANDARKIIIDLINDNSEVDFALQIFNYNNNSQNGGRIIYGFNDLSIPANKTDLLNLLDEDTDNTNSNYKVLQGNRTPLCEALYETYRYFSGGEVYYGNDHNVTTTRPSSIITSGNYTSPFSGITCDKEITIIYITDGAPVGDNDADTKVKQLTGANNSDKYNDNFMGVLGSWMSKINWLTMNDIDATSESQVIGSVKIHTVGFGSISSDTDTVNLLKLAARDGEAFVDNSSTGFHDTPEGGEYHEASDADALKTALANVLLQVLDNSSLTSASVSANSFDRTQTLDAVYYGMFEPSTAARWQGNLKKYKIVNGEQVDANGNTAVNSEGNFDEDGKSFWSDGVDGNEVAEGGVAEMLRAKSTSSRKLLTDIDGTGTLTLFTESNITTKYNTDALLADAFGVLETDVAEVPDHIDWARGVDVDNYDGDATTDIRPDVFGDPLHSKPITINYGGTGDNIRIVVGTNAGVLHMFEDISDTEVIENWAYLPNEFFKNIDPLRENVIETNNKIYGLDGEITLYLNDLDNDGVVDATAGETAWLFFGLRRGGSSYYAIDVTYKDAPKLMWHIDNTGSFADLGLTFSKPKVVKSALNTTDTDNLVVIFGGGYDTEKDNTGPNSHNDSLGASIYMVNARTGALIFNTPTGNKNGIASSVATLDSDSDGLVDRLYVGDTGGSVWRLDMPDATLANNSIIELASLGGVTNDDDRRFFNEPDIVRTYILETYDTGTSESPNIIKQEVPYDAVLLGSGDRATPINGETSDMFFMIKDEYIKTQTFGTSPATAIPSAITLTTLYDYTDDPFNGYPTLTASQENNLLDASLAKGWYFELEQTGEKSSAKSITINNVVYFTTYTPSSTTSCSVVPGDAWLYAVDLALGIKKYNWATEDTDNREDRIKHVGNQFTGAPTLISTPVVDDVTGETDIEGNLIVGKEVIPVGFTLQTMRTSLTIPEN